MIVEANGVGLDDCLNGYEITEFRILRHGGIISKYKGLMRTYVLADVVGLLS